MTLVGGENRGIEPCRLTPEHQCIPWAEICVEVALGSAGAEELKARFRVGVRERLEVRVLVDVDQMPVIDAGPSHGMLVDAKTELPHQMQR